jgi:hypothetical protein
LWKELRIWTYPPLGWIAYVPLFAVYVVVLAVIVGGGKLLGAPSLIWHDQTGTKIWAGFSAAVLTAQLGMVGYLLDSRESSNPEIAPDVATVGSVARYLTVPSLILLAVVIWGFTKHRGTTPLAGLVLIGPAVGAGLVLLLRHVQLGEKQLLEIFPKTWRPMLKRLVEWPHKLAPERGTEAPDPGAHALQLALLIALALLYGAAYLGRHHVAAAAAFSVALALALGVWGLLRFWIRRYRLFWSIVLIVIVCAAGATRDRAARDLSKVRFPTHDAPAKGSVSDLEARANWEHLFPGRRPPLVVVATSGGAMRAALWTLNVLGSLEQRMPGFLSHVRIITGASGGMVGAAHLVATLNAQGPPLANLDIDWFHDVMEDVAKDSLTAVARALIMPGMDRGEELERIWEKSSHGRLGHPMRDLLGGEKKGWLPSLVFSPMLVEDGRRLLVSNLDLAPLVQSKGPLVSCPPDCLQSISGLQLFACEGEGVQAVRLSTVARMSATFPWVTSASRLTTHPDRRVVDAGYYDNYGVDIATAWIHHNADWLAEHTSGVLLVQIRDEPAAAPEVTSAQAGLLSRWSSALTTPVDGLLNAWGASMSFRNDQKIEVLATEPRLRDDRFFATAVFEYPGKAPLEWYLDRESIKGLQVPPSVGALDDVQKWWDGRPSELLDAGTQDGP